MFVGHYAASLALKSVEKRASLGVLFLAVQWVDIVFFPLVLLGVERMNIVEHATPSTHFELVYMPFTHSLLGALSWSVLAFAACRWLFGRTARVALVVAVAVFSHWVLDLLVHTPDLPLWSDSSTKFGLGLWNHPVATYALEAALLLGTLWLYLRSTNAGSAIGKYGMPVFVLALLLINAVNIFGPLQGDNQWALSITALASYFGFAAVAFWLDRKRS